MAQRPPRTVLVVDDEPLVRRSIRRSLTRAGYAVLDAGSVGEAVSMVEEHRIEAAIVDYTLAAENGLEVLARLRLLQPHCVRILCTGRTELPIFVEAVNTGEVARVIRKPFEVHDLLAQLEEALSSQAQLERYTTQQHGASQVADRQSLQQALRPGSWHMALQPIVEFGLPTAPARYQEALLRCRHPELSNPQALLAAAERQGRSVEVGSLALEAALRSLSRVPTDQGLFVNLHPEQLGQPELLRQILEPWEASAGRVTLEITERSRLQDIARWDESVAHIADLGFSVAVDDLGAGYSSLSILADLQPQFIKLDMSLVRGVDREPRKQRLVQLMATFGAATDAGVIAEGVETADEARALADCGIRLAQGYWFGRPVELPDQ